MAKMDEMAEAEIEVMTTANESMGGAAPMVRGGLEKKQLTRLADQLAKTMDTLTDGNFPMSEMIVQIEFEESSEQMPPELFGPLAALVQAVSELADSGIKAAEPYVVEIEEVAGSNDGVKQAIEMLVAMANDQGLLNELKAPRVEEEASEETEEEVETPEGEEEEFSEEEYAALM